MKSYAECKVCERWMTLSNFAEDVQRLFLMLREYTDVRPYRIKDVSILNNTIFEEDCPELEALGTGISMMKQSN